MSSSKKIHLLGVDFGPGVYLSKAQNPTPSPPPPQGKGEGGELNQREDKKGNSLQSWDENTNMSDW